MTKRKIKTPGVYLDNNGTYYLKYKNRTYRGFKSVSDAEVKKAQLKLSNESTSDYSFEVVALDYLEFEMKRYQTEEISYGSYNRKESVLRLHILPEIGKYDLKSLSPLIARDFRNNLADKELSSVYKNDILTTARAVLKHATKYYEYTDNLTLHLDSFPKTALEKNKRKARFENIWTQEEFNSFIDKIDELEYKLIFILMFNHGMRVGEVQGLLWNKVDFKNKRIIIDGSITKKTKHKGVERKSTKTQSGERIIYVGENTTNKLKELHKRVKAYHGYKETSYIFGLNKPVTLRQIDRRREKAITGAGIRYATNHDMRHMFVTNSWSSVPTPALSAYVGHKNVATTLERYSHLSKKDNDVMSDFIDNL